MDVIARCGWRCVWSAEQNEALGEKTQTETRWDARSNLGQFLSLSCALVCCHVAGVTLGG